MLRKPPETHRGLSPSTSTRLQRLLTKLFREHWQSVHEKLAEGVDVAAGRAEFFYASRDRECLKLARSYYAPVRSTTLANASHDEILRLSAAWFNEFRDHVKYDLVKGKELHNELRRLLAAEYVAVARPSSAPSDRSCQEATSVSPLPDQSVVYGDVYEITASGFSSGAYLRVCKSVAEPFSESERTEAMVGLKREFFENADSSEDGDAWRIKFRRSKDPRVIEADIIPISKIMIQLS